MADWTQDLLGAKTTKPSKPPSHSQQKRVSEALSVDEADDHTVAKFDLDQFSADEKEGLSKMLVEESDYSLFEGTIEHGYTLEFTGNAHKCPRCNTKTEQMYGQFIYATQSEPRIMLAPAGYFCLDCPTVIIDEHIIESGIVGKFRFKGTIGMSHDGEDFYPFETRNGEKPIFMLNEGGNVLGVTTKGKVNSQEVVKPAVLRGKTRQQRKIQKAKKKQRKQNRKRK